MGKEVFVFILFISFLGYNSYCFVLEPCTGEIPDVCGYLPSTYANLSLFGVPPLCFANCTLEGGFDLCGICGGIAPITQIKLEPTTYIDSARLGGSVAIWNGTVAVSQHIAQDFSPLVEVTVLTWNLDHTDNTYSLFELPSSIDGSVDGVLPQSKGYGLIMSEHYLVVGAHDATPRVVQLWLRTVTPPWTLRWTANDPCPGKRFGFSVGIDEDLPRSHSQGIFGSVVVGDPGARFTGRVYVYLTYSSGLLQTLFLGFGNETDTDCFGEAVSADAGILAIGAPSFTFIGQAAAGSVYIYRWNHSAGIQGLYEFVTQITPPIPTVNGGFGLSVSTWNSYVMIGDNQRMTYLYTISGLFAIPLLFEQPESINIASTLGTSVSIWGPIAAAGDENFIPSFTATGGTFTWTPDALFPLLYLPRWVLTDDLTSVDTRYGADVDVRGGCYLASGITGELPYGGVYITNLCQNDCYGCDGILNSCLNFDDCGVCNGDNSTCTDCFGVIHGPAVNDTCGVCAGTNRTCVVPVPITENIACNTTFTVPLNHLFEHQWGAATWIILVAPTKGSVVITGSGTLNVTLTYTAFPYQTGSDDFQLNVTIITTHASTAFTIFVTLGSCLDCFGVSDGPARFDECGVCSGDNSTCAGCDGVPNSGLTLDYCDVCGGDNSTCIDITPFGNPSIPCTSQLFFQFTYEPSATPALWSILTQPPTGSVFIHAVTGVALYQNPDAIGPQWFIVKITSLLNSSVTNTLNVTFIIEDCTDCSGAQMGTQLIDLCGICGGDSTSCMDCAGVPNGLSVLDICGICAGDGLSCLDCFGVYLGGAVVDLCGVCGGDNSSCIGSGGVGVTFIIIWVFFGIVIFLSILWVISIVLRNWEAIFHPPPPPAPQYPRQPVTDGTYIRPTELRHVQHSSGNEIPSITPDDALIQISTGSGPNYLFYRNGVQQVI